MKAKILWFFDNIEEVAGAISLALVVILLFVQVVSRAVFNQSIPVTEELSRFAFLWMVYIACSLAVKTRSHIRVTAQFKPFPVKVQNLFIMLGDFIWVIFNCVVVWYGIQLFINMTNFPLISPVLDWSVKWIFVIIPITFALQIFRIFQGYYYWIKAGAITPLIPAEVDEGGG